MFLLDLNLVVNVVNFVRLCDLNLGHLNKIFNASNTNKQSSTSVLEM